MRYLLIALLLTCGCGEEAEEMKGVSVENWYHEGPPEDCPECADRIKESRGEVFKAVDTTDPEKYYTIAEGLEIDGYCCLYVPWGTAMSYSGGFVYKAKATNWLSDSERGLSMNEVEQWSWDDFDKLDSGELKAVNPGEMED